MIVSLVQMFEILQVQTIQHVTWIELWSNIEEKRFEYLLASIFERILESGKSYTNKFSALKDVSYSLNCFWGEGLSHEVKAGFFFLKKICPMNPKG